MYIQRYLSRLSGLKHINRGISNGLNDKFNTSRSFFNFSLFDDDDASKMTTKKMIISTSLMGDIHGNFFQRDLVRGREFTPSELLDYRSAELMVKHVHEVFDTKLYQDNVDRFHDGDTSKYWEQIERYIASGIRINTALQNRNESTIEDTTLSIKMFEKLNQNIQFLKFMNDIQNYAATDGADEVGMLELWNEFVQKNVFEPIPKELIELQLTQFFNQCLVFHGKEAIESEMDFLKEKFDESNVEFVQTTRKEVQDVLNYFETIHNDMKHTLKVVRELQFIEATLEQCLQEIDSPSSQVMFLTIATDFDVAKTIVNQHIVDDFKLSDTDIETVLNETEKLYVAVASVQSMDVIYKMAESLRIEGFVNDGDVGSDLQEKVSEILLKNVNVSTDEWIKQLVSHVKDQNMETTEENEIIRKIEQSGEIISKHKHMNAYESHVLNCALAFLMDHLKTNPVSKESIESTIDVLLNPFNEVSPVFHLQNNKSNKSSTKKSNEHGESGDPNDGNRKRKSSSSDHSFGDQGNFDLQYFFGGNFEQNDVTMANSGIGFFKRSYNHVLLLAAFGKLANEYPLDEFLEGAKIAMCSFNVALHEKDEDKLRYMLSENLFDATKESILDSTEYKWEVNDFEDCGGYDIQEIKINAMDFDMVDDEISFTILVGYKCKTAFTVFENGKPIEAKTDPKDFYAEMEFATGPFGKDLDNLSWKINRIGNPTTFRMSR